MKKMLFATIMIIGALAPSTSAQNPQIGIAALRAINSMSKPNQDEALARRNPCKPCVFVGPIEHFDLWAIASDPLFGTNIWTKTNGATGIDVRSSAISGYVGNVWVVWDNSFAPNEVIVYLAADSVVANQLFFAAPGSVLSLTSAAGTSGDNLIPTLTDTPLPAAVLAMVNGALVGAAVTDVRPEDAMFAVNRALGTLDTRHYNGLGYGPGPIGTAIHSTYTSKSATPVAFAISGKDPITGSPILPWKTTAFGAQPVIVFVNTSASGPADFGNRANFGNVSRFDLARALNGTNVWTSDLSTVPGLPQVPLNVLLPDPISGTANVMEFSVPRNVEINSTQELGVNPASGGNPLNLVSSSGGWRRRVIGTGEMTTEVAANVDTLGIAPWSTSTFAGIESNTRYLTVDGVDPLFASYSGGSFPSCSYPCPGAVKLSNVANGSYPIWSILRVISASPVPPEVSALVQSVQIQATNFAPDFVPISKMNVFRSHFSRPGMTGATSNGHILGRSESGGDVGGAVLTVQSDLDSISETGKEIVNLKQ